MPRCVHDANGLTVRQEVFAQLLARGQNLSDSYRQAYASTGNAKTVNKSASRLWQKPEIRARVEALCQRQSAEMMRDSIAIRRHVLSRLLAESQDMENKGSERIAALVHLGRIDTVSMFREVHAVERFKDRPPEDIEAELRAKLGVFLEGSTRERGTERTSSSRSTEINGVSLLRRGNDQTDTDSVAGSQGANGQDR